VQCAVNHVKGKPSKKDSPNMGIAASQAQLLSITARINDVEFKAQQIMNEKVNLATRQDAVYDEYCAALDSKKLQIAYNNSSGALNYVDATFASVCGYSNERNGTYALVDESTGLMIVENDVYSAYKDYEGGDKYSFAWRMLGFEEGDFAWSDNDKDGTGTQVGVDSNSGNAVTVGEGAEQFNVLAMTDVEQYVFDKHEADLDPDVAAKYEKYQEALETKDKSKIADALNKFRSAFTEKYKEEIYNAMRLDKDNGISKSDSIIQGDIIPGFDNQEFDSDIAGEFNYYVRLFEGIENAGGCIPISKYSKDGDTGNDWFNNLISTGMVSLNEYDKRNGWTVVSPATSTNMREVSDDVAIKKAEAKYKHDLKELENKEKELDRNLTNLETERQALTEQRDSIKTVIKENIDRTFKIFS